MNPSEQRKRAIEEKIKELFGIEFHGQTTILYDKGIGEVEPKNVFVDSEEVIN